MKQSKTCPKCGSKEVIFIAENMKGDELGDHIYCGFFTAATVNRHICCDCGYTEQYVNKSDIQMIREYYKK